MTVISILLFFFFRGVGGGGGGWITPSKEFLVDYKGSVLLLHVSSINVHICLKNY